MADHIQNIGCKMVFFYIRVIRILSDNPLLSFLMSQEYEEHGKISSSYRAESDLDAVTL